MNFLHLKQKGSVLILMAFTIPLLMLCSAIAVDVGSFYVQRSRMQNIADAAALAGATKLGEASTTDATTYAQAYINKNTSDSIDSINITFPVSNDSSIKNIKVELIKNPPLLFFKFFQSTWSDWSKKTSPVVLTVHAIAAYNGGSKNIFDYSLISGAKNGDTINTSKISYDSNNPDPRVLNLGYGGGNTYNDLIHSNYQINKGGGNNTVNGTATTVDKNIWSNPSAILTLNGTANGSADAIDISVTNSTLADMVANLKSNPNYLGNYSSSDYTGAFNTATLAANGKGLYVKGNFNPSYTQALTNSTIIIADGDISVPSPNGQNLSTNHIIFCSLHGNITFNFYGTFNGILYAPEGHIGLSGGGMTFNGSIIGQTLKVGDGNNTITHASFPETGGSDSSTKIQLIE